uniref:phenylalanine 4-monooxygenase n=1 Tax=Neobodo designis TaxID=312471 RepID=A0A7S1LIH3_NEODS
MLRRSARVFCAQSFEEQYRSAASGIKGGSSSQLSSIHIGVNRSECGALLDVLRKFEDADISLEHIQSRRTPLRNKSKVTSIMLHAPYVKTHPKMVSVMAELEKMNLPILSVQGSWDIPWFPTCAADLDLLDQQTLAAGAELADDPENPHPGFHDQEYRSRRTKIVEAAHKYRHGQPLPDVDYNEAENKTWEAVWKQLTGLHNTHACKEYNRAFPRLIESANFRRDRVPQLSDLSNFLQEETGFTLRPVAGLLSTRDFLNALAFRVFYSTQYIRHHSKPFYTPEPDCVHELLGHAPLFADPAFADFSQEIGLLSLGASDADIDRLGKLYWYSVEFGLTKEGGSVRAYGAGLLSSFGELEYSLTDKPKKLPWDPWVASELEFPITTYQPTYFVAESFVDAQDKLRAFGRTFDRPFFIEHIAATNSVRTWPMHDFQ